MLLIQKGMKPFVVGRRQIENFEESAIAATRMLQSPIDQRSELDASQFTRFECLVHDCPEIFSGQHPIPLL